jgi:hypothetical protein
MSVLSSGKSTVSIFYLSHLSNYLSKLDKGYAYDNYGRGM